MFIYAEVGGHIENVRWFLRIIFDEWMLGDSKIHESSVILEIDEPQKDQATALEFTGTI